MITKEITMRKIVASLFMLATLPLAVMGASGPQTLTNETALPYANTYTQNLQAYGTPQAAAGKLSATVTYGSATVASQSFFDGSQSTGSLTVVSTAPLVAASATDSITMPSTAAILGSPATAQMTIVSTTTLTLSSPTITIFNGSQNLMFTWGGNWASSDTVNHAAATLASAINGVGGLSASSAAGVVYASTTLNGVFGNSYTLSSSSTSVSTSAVTFSGGKNPALLSAYFTINGANYRNGYHWSDVSGTSTGTAASIATFINSISTNTNPICGGGLGSIYATATGGVVTLTTALKCAGGNATTLTTTPSSGGMTIGSANFTGGQDNASITINGTTLTLGTDFAPPLVASTTANLATSIAAAVNANTTLNKIITSAAISSVVTSTSVGVGSVNYTTVSSTQSKLSFANATMTGGTTSAVTLNSGVISLPSHGFTKALAVSYNGTPAIGGLSTGTTYFVAVIDANNIGLSSTSVVAQAGNYIAITSTNTQVTKHTYTLVPSTWIAGSAGGAWQVSNDCTNGPWANYTTTAGNVVVSSQSYNASGSTSVAQDFGQIDYGCLRYNVTAPTQGAVSLKVILNAKD